MTRAEELNITIFPYYEDDEQGRHTYIEDGNGYWRRFEYLNTTSDKILKKTNSSGDWCIWKYNDNEDLIEHGNSNGYNVKIRYNKRNQELTYRTTRGYWHMSKYNRQGMKTHYSNSTGYLVEWKYHKNKIISKIDSDKEEYWNYNKRGDLLRYEKHKNNSTNKVIIWKEYKYNNNNELVHYEDSNKNWWDITLCNDTTCPFYDIQYKEDNND